MHCTSAEFLRNATDTLLQPYGPATRFEAQGMQVVLDEMAEDQGKLTCEAVLLGDFNEKPRGPAITYHGLPFIVAFICPTIIR